MSAPPIQSHIRLSVSEPHLASLHQLSDSYADVFDAVDSLREAGLQRQLIPKLVVVGDQKSGKSSVLEAICQIPFPVDEGLCTRFPTEVVQRKSVDESITVTINVVGVRDNREALTGFYRKLSLGDSAGLATAMKKASSLILDVSSVSDSRSHFSEDVLKITISGPGRYPITLVDLPGLFYSHTHEQDGKDKVTVDKMVRGYLKEPRNALLLVVPCRTSWPTMLAPAEVGKPGADPKGLRTLGIITGLDTSFARQAVLDRFEKGPWNPRHGWHCLRNRSKEERDRNEDRDSIEATYFSENWPEVDEAYKGIANLRPKLSKLLACQVQLYLHDLISEVRAQIEILNKTHRYLGKRNMSELEQRSLLSRMAVEFEHLCCNAVTGHYGEGLMPTRSKAFFHDNSKDSPRTAQDKRLQAVVRAMGQLFNSTMLKNGKSTEIGDFNSSMSDTIWQGQSQFFGTETNGTLEESTRLLNRTVTNDKQSREKEYSEEETDEEGEGKHGSDEESEEEDEEEDEEEGEEESEDESEDEIGALRSSGCGILRPHVYRDYKSQKPSVAKSLKDFESKVRNMAGRWRGTESLDDVNPAMVSELVREETSRWRDISDKHLKLVWKAVDRFVHLALEHCVDPSFLPSLKHFVVDRRLDELKAHAEQELEKLLQCHESMNPAFHDFLSELHDEDLKLGASITSTKEHVGKQLMEQVKSALSSKALEKIMELASHSAGGAMPLPFQTSLVNLLLAKVKDTVSEAVQGNGAEDIPEAPNRRKLEQAAVNRAIRMTEKYYKVSVMSFVAYVNALVIHHGLLERLPFAIFTHDIVTQQGVEIISNIAGEKEDTTKKRLECEKRLAILKKALASFDDFQKSIS